MSTPHHQILEHDTPSGHDHIFAPGGWEFDKTAINVWGRLLWLSRPNQKFAKKRDEFVNDGQINVLASMLANSLGMATFYWEQEAKKIAKVTNI